MLQSYFFIPTNRMVFVSKVTTLDADYFIFDMEESVREKDIDLCIENLRTIGDVKDNYWLRLPTEDCEKYDQIVSAVFEMGFRKILLPKIYTAEQIKSIKNRLPQRDYTLGILVESAQALVHFSSIAANVPHLRLVMIGSHDFCNEIGCRHAEENMVYLRQKLLVECKALSIPIVDYVSTNFSDLKQYQQECVRANDMGFDGKAIIHPKQLQAFNETLYYTKDEVTEAKKVMDTIDQLPEGSFATINVDGHLYERPHLKHLKSIIEWNNKRNYYDI